MAREHHKVRCSLPKPPRIEKLLPAALLRLGRFDDDARLSHASHSFTLHRSIHFVNPP
jgi:hypothetical protein